MKHKPMLSSRWSNQEKEQLGSSQTNDATVRDDGSTSALNVDTRGFGKLRNADISSWSRGISKPFGSQFKPIRPEVYGVVRNTSLPVRSLKDCESFANRKVESHHNPLEVETGATKMLNPCDENLIDARRGAGARRRLALSENFARVYKAFANKRKKFTVKEYA